MLNALNLYRSKTPREIIEGVKDSVDAFVGDAPQFDDITMLCLEMNGKIVRRSLTTEAVLNQPGEVEGLVNGVMDELGCPANARKKVNLAVEEIFVNIAGYAYGSDGGTVSVEVAGSRTEIAVTFRDSGVPYDPLQKPDPDVTLSADQRQVGGLGIYLVKKNMDTVSYSSISSSMTSSSASFGSSGCTTDHAALSKRLRILYRQKPVGQRFVGGIYRLHQNRRRFQGGHRYHRDTG